MAWLLHCYIIGLTMFTCRVGVDQAEERAEHRRARERPLIFVRSPDLVAGTSAEVVLRFEKAGEVSMRVPVYRNQDELVTVSPQVATPANG